MDICAGVYTANTKYRAGRKMRNSTVAWRKNNLSQTLFTVSPSPKWWFFFLLMSLHRLSVKLNTLVSFKSELPNVLFPQTDSSEMFFFYVLFIIDPEQARHCTTATSGGPAWQISVDILLLLHSDCVFLCRHGNTGPRRPPHQQELPQRKFGVYICSSAFRHTSCHLLVRDMVAQLEKYMILKQCWLK